MALSWEIIAIVDPQVWGIEEMIQRFEVTAIGMHVCGIRDITKEHYSFIVWSF